MSASAFMARLVLLALASRECSGQEFMQNQNTLSQQSSGNYQGDPYANNGGGSYGGNGVIQNGQCPFMNELGSASKLQVMPWAWFRTVNIVQPSSMMSDASGGNGIVQPVAATPQGSSDSTLLPDTAQYRALAQVRSTIGWAPTMGLYSPLNGRQITEIVNPGFVWDTTQEIFDCNGQLLGKIRYEFSWSDLFTGAYATHQVENAQGNHIANLLQETMTESYIGSGQRFIYIADLSGQPLASMRHPTGGWQVGPFGEYFECEIQMQSLNVQVSPPAMNPEFLGLVMANAMAGDHLLGPFISLIFWPVFILLLLSCCIAGGIGCDTVTYWLTCCGLLTCFGLCASGSAQQSLDSAKASSKEYQDSANQEKDSLLASAKNATGQGGSSWNCCSRRQPAIVAPTISGHGH